MSALDCRESGYGRACQVWPPADSELCARLAQWAEEGPDAECVEYKRGRVWRWRDVVVKRYCDGWLTRTGLRAPTAWRVARLGLALPDGAAARPLATLRWSRAISLLAAEFVPGRTMLDAWRSDAACVDALPLFMARLHDAGAFHGDLHPGNLLWTGARWVLLDLESLRHPLRTLRRRALAVDQWARLHYRLHEDLQVKAAFEEYLRIRAVPWDSDVAWREVLAQVPRLRALRGGAPLEP